MAQKQLLLSGQESAAHAARLCKAEGVPHFPAPLSKDIAVALSKIHKCDLYDVESQSSAATAAIATSLSEKRAFLPLSKIRDFEALCSASSLRAPLVSVQAASHDNFMLLRDAGWLMFSASTNQEVLDSVVQSYVVSEDKKVALPSMINMDMCLREIVSLSGEQMISSTLPKLKLARKLSIRDAQSFDYEERNHEQIHKAMENALRLLHKSSEKMGKKFKRNFGLIENFMLSDAEYVFVVAGYQSGTAKSAVRKLRNQGEKVGLLRLRVLRPWPSEEISRALANAKRIAVVESAISLGASGVLHTHLKAALQGHISSFISQKHLTEKNFSDMFMHLKKQEKPERIWM